MPEKRPVSSPSKYVLPTAIGFSSASGDLVLVTPNAPLPVLITNGASGIGSPNVASSTIAPAKPLAGKAGASTVAGPFVPVRDTPMHLQLSGTWQGTVTLERSIDGGKTRQGVTAGGQPWARFNTNVNEPVWQESASDASFWLKITLDSGQLSYRLS